MHAYYIFLQTDTQVCIYVYSELMGNRDVYISLLISPDE